jgi:hypothetical protein
MCQFALKIVKGMRLRRSRQYYYVNEFPYGNLKYVGGDINTAKEFLMRRVYVFLVVGIVLFGACSAQRADAQNANIAQKIIGTWVDQQGTTWVFNANGNLTRGTTVYKFGVTDTKLQFESDSKYGTRDANTDDIYDISISSDGKTLILSFPSNGFMRGYWLTKK